MRNINESKRENIIVCPNIYIYIWLLFVNCVCCNMHIS